MLDRPYLDQKTYDLVRVIDWLISVGNATHIRPPKVGAGWQRRSLRAVGHRHSDHAEAVSDVLLAPGRERSLNWLLSTLPPGILARRDRNAPFAIVSPQCVFRPPLADFTHPYA